LHPTLNNVAKMPEQITLLLNIGTGVFVFGQREVVMKTNNTDVGIMAVNEIYENLRIDTEWSLIHEKGFTWWGHRQAQRVWTEEPFEGSGMLISKVNAETDSLICSNRLEYPADQLARYLCDSSLSGLVVDNDRIKYRCSAFIHEENQHWLVPLFTLAVIMQTVEAINLSMVFEKTFGLLADHSQHPDNGPRQYPDDMLAVTGGFIKPKSEEAIKYIGEEDFVSASKIIGPGLDTVADGSGLSVNIPFGNDLALLLACKQTHPFLGKGLLITHILPAGEVETVCEVNGSLIMDMNAAEQSSLNTGHFLGSWCLGPPVSDRKTPVFVSFIPAIACNRSVLVNMILSTLWHNTWAEGYFFAFDRDVMKPSPAFKEVSNEYI
jgi:hypothetical protein